MTEAELNLILKAVGKVEDSVNKIWETIDSIKEQKRLSEKESDTKITRLETEMGVAKWASKMATGGVVMATLSFISSIVLAVLTLI